MSVTSPWQLFKPWFLCNKVTGPWLFAGTRPFLRLQQPNRRGVFLVTTKIPNILARP